MNAPFDEYDAPAKPALATLNTRGLILIPATVDIPDYSHWLNDPEVVKFSELRHREHTWEECQKYIASFDQDKNCMWTINVIGANMHIGNITAHHDPHNNVMQMGMLIGEKWAWGRKYGREAWGAVLTWAKDTKKVRQVEAGCMISNSGMRQVMTKTGMGHACTLNDHFVLNGKPEAKVIYRA